MLSTFHGDTLNHGNYTYHGETMNLKAGRGEKPISVRLPEPVKLALDEAAGKSGRSRNSEIVQRLAGSLGLSQKAKRR